MRLVQQEGRLTHGLRAVWPPALSCTRRNSRAARRPAGATICKPRDPACGECPVSSACHALRDWREHLASGGDKDIEGPPNVTAYPFKVQKADKKAGGAHGVAPAWLPARGGAVGVAGCAAGRGAWPARACCCMQWPRMGSCQGLLAAESALRQPGAPGAPGAAVTSLGPTPSPCPLPPPQVQAVATCVLRIRPTGAAQEAAAELAAAAAPQGADVQGQPDQGQAPEGSEGGCPAFGQSACCNAPSRQLGPRRC
jgi:hypothetical protein